MKLVVCSGATVPFNELVAAFDASMLKFLKERGFSDVVVQYGHASGAFKAKPPHLTGFDFDPNIRELISTADFVVSHAGTGSLLDALRSPNKPKVVAVVNSGLMDNHQLEVAHKLAASKCLVMTTPEKIYEAIDEALTTPLDPLPEPKLLADVAPELVA